MAKLSVAYFLWLLLGMFGVHHFYLKRDRHAFVWWATLGGFFGLGWIRDFWRLAKYVKEANEDEMGLYSQSEDERAGYVNGNDDHHDAAVRVRRRSGGPKISGTRFFGMVVMGYIMGYLVMFALPQEIFKTGNKILVSVFFMVVPSFGVAVGTHLVASIGRIQASFQWCLVGSGIGVLWRQFDEPTNIAGSCLLSALTVYYMGLSWKPFKRPRKGKCKRMSTLFAWGSVYFLLWGFSLYFNTTITTNDGEEVPLRVAIHNFFSSPAWKETKQTLNTVWQHIKVNGWRTVFEGIVNAIDPEGENNSYKVLGLSSSASQREIKEQYKKLAKEWHPDKQKDPAKKAEAQEKFMEIKNAYEILSNIQTRRAQKKKKSSRHDEF